jgi:hypothetical protein
MNKPLSNPEPHYIKGKAQLTTVYLLSLLIALLLAVASVMGLLNPQAIYPSEALQQSFFANDVVNLVIGLPALLIALWLAWRGRVVGLLFLPGALMFVLYTYLAYIFGMPPGWYYLLLLTLVALCAYTLIGLVASLDLGLIAARLAGRVPAQLTGILLLVFGAFVFLRVFVVVYKAAHDPGSIAPADLTILPADFLIAPAWILGGVLLLRKQALGYASGLGLLFQASMLFIGLIAFMLLQPLMTEAPFDLAGVLVVAVMSMVCLIPFGLYLRGAVGDL